MVALTMTALSGCKPDDSGSNNGNNNGDPTQTTGGDEQVLASNKAWETTAPEGGGTYVSVMFYSHYNASGPILVDDLWVRKTVLDSEGYDLSNIDWDGKYTYKGDANSGSGTMKLYVVGSDEDTVRATFTVSGKTMSLKLQNEAYTLHSR